LPIYTISYMIIEHPEDYTLVGFERSNVRGKKYDAILRRKKTRKERRVPFGAVGYEQFKDSTGKGLYTHVNHGDPKRRRNYRTRHNGENKRKFSSGYFSWKYLW
jgi:hypothetical protein